MAEQYSIFDFIEGVAPSKKETKAAIKPQAPSELIFDKGRSIVENLGRFGINYICFTRGYNGDFTLSLNPENNTMRFSNISSYDFDHGPNPFGDVDSRHYRHFRMNSSGHSNEFESFEAPLLFCDASGKAWITQLQISMSPTMIELWKRFHEITPSFAYSRKPVESAPIPSIDTNITWNLTKPVLVKKLLHPTEYNLLQSKEDLSDIIERTNPYAYKWVSENGYRPEIYLMAPQIEILSKAGYSFQTHFIGLRPARHTNKSDYTMFNALCQPGRSPKEIFKVPKTVYSALLDVVDLSVWDGFRKLNKTNTLTAAEVQTVKEIISNERGGYRGELLKEMSDICKREFNEKKIFTIGTLSRYLARIDFNEAITAAEGLPILSDYLRMCEQLNRKPVIDGDSLKREHDVTTRTYMQYINERKAVDMQESCNWLQRFNFEDDKYLCRAVRSYDDLIDEANQQRNCVACYAESIKSRRSLIFFMREKDRPNRSLITIELSPACDRVRQQFLSFNRVVEDPEQKRFIEKFRTRAALIRKLKIDDPALLSDKIREIDEANHWITKEQAYRIELDPEDREHHTAARRDPAEEYIRQDQPDQAQTYNRGRNQMEL